MDTAQGSLLVVDDNEMNRDMLARRLARRGYTVAVAEDGRQALAIIETQQFDLVLLDIMMPGISGLDVLQILRQRYSMAALPVIMATAKDQSEDIVAALQLGANDYRRRSCRSNGRWRKSSVWRRNSSCATASFATPLGAI